MWNTHSSKPEPNLFFSVSEQSVLVPKLVSVLTTLRFGSLTWASCREAVPVSTQHVGLCLGLLYLVIEHARCQATTGGDHPTERTPRHAIRLPVVRRACGTEQRGGVPYSLALASILTAMHRTGARSYCP
jgi:hypothetical protein